MAGRPQGPAQGSSRESPLVTRLKRISDWLSHPQAWARLLLSAVALIAVGLSYGAWDPNGTGLAGVWVAILGGILLLYGCLLVFPRTLSQGYPGSTVSVFLADGLADRVSKGSGRSGLDVPD